VPTDLLPVAVLLAIAPGYMTIYFATHGRTGRPLEPDLRLVLQALTISAAILAVLGPPAYAVTLSNAGKPLQEAISGAAWLVAIVLVAPFVLGFIARQMISRLNKRPQHWAARAFRFVVPEPIAPSVWDWASLRKVFDGKFVVVEYTDGKKIGGSYGVPGGIAFTSPEEHGVFLVCEFKLGENGEPTVPVEASAGVLVPLDNGVRVVRIFDFDKKGGATVSDEPETKIAIPDSTRGAVPAEVPAPTQGAVPAGPTQGAVPANLPAPTKTNTPSEPPQPQPSQPAAPKVEVETS
jgi:uncharacterized protein DUF6338